MKHRTYGGKVRYLGDEVGERGREWFTVTVHDDGQRTVRARCEMDDSQILRDVTYTVDGLWRPVDAFVRLTIADRFAGSGWFRFGDGFAECEALTATAGRVSQRMEYDGRPRSFGPHPVVCDIWHFGAADRSAQAPARQSLADTLVSSVLPNGASGPLLERFDVEIERYEPEEVTVPAGTFACEHWAFVFADDPPEHVWFTSDDLLLVKIRWDLLSTTYLLDELHR